MELQQNYKRTGNNRRRLVHDINPDIGEMTTGEDSDNLQWESGSVVLDKKSREEKEEGAAIAPQPRTCSTLVKKQTVAKATLTTRKSFWLTDGSLPADEPEEEEEGDDEEEEEEEEAAVDETPFITAVVRVAATVEITEGALASSDIVMCGGLSSWWGTQDKIVTVGGRQCISPSSSHNVKLFIVVFFVYHSFDSPFPLLPPVFSSLRISFS
ncbi:hypothetical protein E2C01_048785 [Portunus trituberculatus]|uniref:Uncharacterized protein n=1 Tax=Portunus trituberculatus TaxID=210409 RepID=A0A5B7GBG1_PORTR|nr:hypothetical protein [Portunus trituberculatus]